MESKGILTKILTIIGLVLVWVPVLAPLVFLLISLVIDGVFRFDYLMPAELFPLALTGGIVLTWAAFRAGSYQKVIGGSLVISVGLLVGSQGLAVITGLATGEADPASWWRIVVLAGIILFSVALISLGIGGIFLFRDLFKSPQP